MHSSNHSRMDKKQCGQCGGKGTVRRVEFSDQKESVQLLGNKIPVMGVILERKCPACKRSSLSSHQRDPESFCDHVKKRGDLTDDSRKLANTESSLVLSEHEVAHFVQQMESFFDQNHLPDLEEPFSEGLPVIAMPVNQNLQVEADPFAALVTEVSLKGVRILHTDSIESNFVLLELMMPNEETIDFVAKVVCRIQFGTTRETCCEFVTK